MTNSIPKYEFRRINNDSFNLKIFIDPVAKGRPRLGRFSVYTPKKTKDFENQIKHVVRLAMKEQSIPYAEKGKIEMCLSFFFKKPKSVTSAFKTTRPDIDNLIKSFTDALNGVLYKDDSQITFCSASKIYSDVPMISVSVSF